MGTKTRAVNEIAFNEKLGYKKFITCIAPTNMRKYQTILNNMITLRAKEELIKTESFESQKHVAENFSMHRKFRYIANFLFIAKISLYSEISTYGEIFAIIAKFSLCLRNCHSTPACFLVPLACIMRPPTCYFFIPGLMKLTTNYTNSAYISSISMPSLK